MVYDLYWIWFLNFFTMVVQLFFLIAKCAVLKQPLSAHMVHTEANQLLHYFCYFSMSGKSIKSVNSGLFKDSLKIQAISKKINNLLHSALTFLNI